MLQSSCPDSSLEVNPLDAFEKEIPEDPAELYDSDPKAPAAPPVPAAPEHHRLEVAEAEILKLRSEIATLVGVIDDISKQLADRTEEPRADRQAKVVRIRMVPRESQAAPRKLGAARVVGVIAGVMLGIVAWRVLTTVEVLEPPRIVAEPQPEPVQAPEPQALAPPQQPQAVAPPSVPGPTPLKVAAIVAPVIQKSPAPPIAPRYVGSLSIDASPGGEVFVDRKSVGPTPVRLDNLRAGSHLIWIERDGYRRWTKVVQVPADQISRVFADLEAIVDR